MLWQSVRLSPTRTCSADECDPLSDYWSAPNGYWGLGLGIGIGTRRSATLMRSPGFGICRGLARGSGTAAVWTATAATSSVFFGIEPADCSVTALDVGSGFGSISYAVSGLVSTSDWAAGADPCCFSC